MIKLLLKTVDTYVYEYGETTTNPNIYYDIMDKNPDHTKEDTLQILETAERYMELDPSFIDEDDEEEMKSLRELFDEHFDDMFEYASCGVSKLEVFLHYLDLRNIKYTIAGEPEPDYILRW